MREALRQRPRGRFVLDRCVRPPRNSFHSWQASCVRPRGADAPDGCERAQFMLRAHVCVRDIFLALFLAGWRAVLQPVELGHLSASSEKRHSSVRMADRASMCRQQSTGDHLEQVIRACCGTRLLAHPGERRYQREEVGAINILSRFAFRLRAREERGLPRATSHRRSEARIPGPRWHPSSAQERLDGYA